MDHLGVPAKTLGLVIFLAIIASLLVYIALSPQKQIENSIPQKLSSEPLQDTTLSILPVQKETGSNYSSVISIDTGKNKVTAVQIELAYDPNILQNLTITPSDFFPNSLELLNNVDTKNGRISFALTVPADEDGIKGSGNLAQISFFRSSQSASQTFIMFLPKTEVSAQNTAVSVLKQAKDAVIEF